jgi:hypothetical protein
MQKKNIFFRPGIGARLRRSAGAVPGLQRVQPGRVRGLPAVGARLVEQPADAADHVVLRMAARVPHRGPQDGGPLGDGVRGDTQGAAAAAGLARRRPWAVHLRLVAGVRPAGGARDAERRRRRRRSVEGGHRWRRRRRRPGRRGVRVLRLASALLLAVREGPRRRQGKLRHPLERQDQGCPARGRVRAPVHTQVTCPAYGCCTVEATAADGSCQRPVITQTTACSA